MARTDAAEVAKVITVDADIDLTIFINTANSLVTQCCTGYDEEYTADELKCIETWLAAHCYAQRDKQIESEKADVVGRKFATKVDLGFNNTYHGQMALRLDYKGGLAALEQRTLSGTASVGVTWLGTPNPNPVQDAE